MTIRIAPVAIALAIAAPHCAIADTAPGETIIVTATRTEIPLSDAIVPVTVISREDIELSLASDLAELLRFQAGIDIGRNGGPGQATSVFMRGTESNHTLVLIDGVRMNPGTLGGAAVQHIAPEMIERIEIERLPQSSRRYPKFVFRQQRPSGKQVIEVAGVSKAYGEKQVLDKEMKLTEPILEKLEERIVVLEQIVTDKRYDLEKQFRDLEKTG